MSVQAMGYESWRVAVYILQFSQVVQPGILRWGIWGKERSGPPSPMFSLPSPGPGMSWVCLKDNQVAHKAACRHCRGRSPVANSHAGFDFCNMIISKHCCTDCANNAQSSAVLGMPLNVNPARGIACYFVLFLFFGSGQFAPNC